MTNAPGLSARGLLAEFVHSQATGSVGSSDSSSVFRLPAPWSVVAHRFEALLPVQRAMPGTQEPVTGMAKSSVFRIARKSAMSDQVVALSELRASDEVHFRLGRTNAPSAPQTTRHRDP